MCLFLDTYTFIPESNFQFGLNLNLSNQKKKKEEHFKKNIYRSFILSVVFNTFYFFQ